MFEVGNLIDTAVWATAGMLIFSKIPDVITTYGFISRSGNIHLERNRLAREVFLRVGLIPGLVLLCIIFVTLTLISPLIYLGLSSPWKTIWGVGFVIYGLFVCVVQLQVAWFNARGEMLQPLKSVHRLLGWWYR